MSNALFSAWHPVKAPASAPDPLAAIEQAIECLAKGQPVPEPAASLLHAGLMRFTQGSSFERAMGLQAAQNGKRTAVQTSSYTKRNGQIRALAGFLEGDCTKAKAKAISALLSAPRPQPCGVQEADMIVNELHLRRQFGLDLPTSTRHIERILSAP